MAQTRLEPLDTATRSKIRSTQIITSLPQVISELVQNSLDSGAKSVDVGVHCEEWTCWVRDDGSGVNKDGLALIAQGMEGGRYSSSKAYSPVCLDHVDTFGFRGEALASVADLSCMEISSRTSRSKESWSIILKGGEKLYYGPSLRWRRERAGTTVSVRDAFFNLPIRRLSHPNASRTIEHVRRDIESVALVFPHVTFSLQDTSKDNHEGSNKSRVLTIPKTAKTLTAFRHLFGRALVEHVDEIDVQSGSMRIEGFISLVGALSKSHQFLYVNRHILDPCHLHRLIDQKFASSSFSKHAFDESGESISPRPGTRRSPRKGERRPIYALNLTIPPREIDNCLDPEKAAVHFQNQDAVASFLADIVQSFLVRHGFGAAQTKAPLKQDNKRKRVDEMIPEIYDASLVNKLTPMKRANTKEIFIREVPSPEDEDEDDLTWVDPISGQTYIIDPRTGNSYIRERRQEDLENPGSRGCGGRRTLVDTRFLKRTHDTGDHECDDGNALEMPDWIRRALEANDTFRPTEACIPQLSSTTPYNDTHDNPGHTRREPGTKHSNKSFSIPSQALGSMGEGPKYSFTKESLERAQVIDQVDRKFIACLVAVSPPDGPCSNERPVDDPNRETADVHSLVLIDQHAADERVRVERYLKALCLGFLDRDGVGVERCMLNPPVPVLLTKFERDRLKGSSRMKNAFRGWGFDVVEMDSKREGSNDSRNEEGYGMVHFESVPEVVADKLLAGSGDDLREVVKGYLARLEAEGLDTSAEREEQTLLDARVDASSADEFTWLRALRFCPRELIELVNSRACRGAIMFNDQLTVEQCKRLLRQLSMTAFPFQCAHGRPSVVPLTTIQRSNTEVEVQSRPIDWANLC
ncbi:hypothetical protein DFH11DRAFT_695793 [Phellopilus nigrolimitatus]|nr:hypothetical protein DFH11DRAFT_695793 [Phellopilus nigrolimitatus]